MRYILVPRTDDLGDALADDRAPVSRAARASRLETLLAARREPPDLDRRLADLVGHMRGLAGDDQPRAPRRAPGYGDALGGADTWAEPPPPMPPVRVLATPSQQTPITGVAVLEAGDDAKPVIRDAFPDYDVVEDFPLELIAPQTHDALDGADPGDDLAHVSEAELWHLRDIGLLAARKLGFTLTGAGVSIGVLDTGVADVPELAGRITENRVFDAGLFDYVMAPITDTDWHGTHVAGIIAGKTVGVAPGSSIVSLTMIPKRVGSYSNYVFALEHAQARPEIQILNMSAGKAGQHPQMRNMAKIAERLDVLAVMAIGNDGVNLTRSPGNYPEVISVGAADASGKVWQSSSGGTIIWDGMQHATPTLVAPGVDVLSSLPDGSYRAETGTSMAAPVVTGIAALLIEKHPDITVRDLRDEILSACISLNLDAGRQGAGMARLPGSILPVAPGRAPVPDPRPIA